MTTMPTALAAAGGSWRMIAPSVQRYPTADIDELSLPEGYRP
ncbi:hypothetical protein [Mycolicibacterium confluentis]|nr:hypothetical protein [Mycolicibacterium confluentis]